MHWPIAKNERMGNYAMPKEKAPRNKTIDTPVSEGAEYRDVLFTSSSTAGNFVTGFSTNGLTAWKTKDGKPLKEALGSD